MTALTYEQSLTTREVNVTRELPENRATRETLPAIDQAASAQSMGKRIR